MSLDGVVQIGRAACNAITRRSATMASRLTDVSAASYQGPAATTANRDNHSRARAQSSVARRGEHERLSVGAATKHTDDLQELADQRDRRVSTGDSQLDPDHATRILGIRDFELVEWELGTGLQRDGSTPLADDDARGACRLIVAEDDLMLLSLARVLSRICADSRDAVGIPRCSLCIRPDEYRSSGVLPPPNARPAGDLGRPQNGSSRMLAILARVDTIREPNRDTE